jgi:hypothetical protein
MVHAPRWETFACTRFIDRDQDDLGQFSLRAQLQHLTEQIGERLSGA